MKSMKVKRYLQGLLLIICLLVTSCAQIIAVNADEQDVSLEITLEDESTPMEGVIFSMYHTGNRCDRTLQYFFCSIWYVPDCSKFL